MGKITVETVKYNQFQSVDRFGNATPFTISKVVEIGTVEEEYWSNEAFFVYVESAGVLVGETKHGDKITYTFSTGKEEYFNQAFVKIFPETTLTGVKLGW